MPRELARELIRGCLDLPAVLDRISDTDDLLTHGVNSGEVVLVALRCEQALGRALSDAELERLDSVVAVDELLKGGVSGDVAV
jgi:Phosphopantetheine attachment site